MAFFNSAVGVLQTLVVALGAGLGIWGAINLLENRIQGRLPPLLRSAEETREQRYQSDADESDSAAGHQLFHALALCAGIIITVTLHQVHAAPHAKTGAQRDDQGLKDIDCTRKKLHTISSVFVYAFCCDG